MTYQQNVFREIQSLQSPISYEVSGNLSIELLSDISDNSTEPLEGYLHGIDLFIDKGTPFEPNSFENLAFNDSGIWTSVKLFQTPVFADPLFKDCFTSGCWNIFTHQALEITYENGKLIQYPIDIGYSPIITNINNYPSYTADSRWVITREVILSKTFSIYNIIEGVTYDLLNETSFTAPSSPVYELLINYELLIDLDSFFRTNIDHASLTDPCALCIFVHIRHKDTHEITPILILESNDNLSSLCSLDISDVEEGELWQELGRLASIDFLAYARSQGLIGVFSPVLSNNTLPSFLDYTPYYTHHFVPNRDNRNAYKDHSQVIRYWVPGAKDIDGNVYLVDIGIFPTCSDIPYLIDTNIPIGSDGRFYTRYALPIGKKYIQIKKITFSTQTTVFTYAPYINSLLKTLNDNNPLTSTLENSIGLKDVKVNLEHLSITLLLLSISNYVHLRDCEYIHNPPFIGDEVIQIIRKNFNTLYELRAPFIEPLNKTNSIPLNLKPITCKESIYDDGFRQGKFLMGWNTYIWQEGCWEGCILINPISREVSNRAMGWLCYALATYRYSINSNEYIGFLIEVSNYIINNMHPVMHLVSNGWLDSEIYSESIMIDEYDTSTSCICCLALIKAYEQTNMYKYLEAAVDIYQGILKYLMLPDEGICADNMTQDTISTETLIYSLWFFTELGRADIVERLISLLNTRVHSGLPLLTASLYQELGEVVYNGMDLVGSIELNPLIHPYSLLNMDVQSYEREQTLTNVIPQLLLAHGIRELLPSENYLSIIDIANTIQPIEGLQALVNENVSISIYLALELCKNKGFLNNSFVRIESRHLINTLIGYRNQAFSVVRAGIPTEFGWFHQKALTISGMAGRLIWMLIRGISSLTVNKNRISEYGDKSSAIGINFDTIIQDFNLYRASGEDKNTFLDTYITYKTRAHNTKESILKLISLFKYPARLVDSPTSIYAQLNTYTTHQYEYTSLLDYGVTNPYHTVHLISTIPLSLDFLQVINQSIPLGISINYITHLAFPYFNQCFPPLSADLFLLRNYSTIEPTITATYIEPISSPLVSECFDSYRIELSNSSPDQLYINYNPDINPSLYLSIYPSNYTISIVEPGVFLKVVTIPKQDN